MISRPKCDDKIVFMQDDAPAHRASVTQEWFKKNKIQTLDWPPKSPDLNPIESPWPILKRTTNADGCTDCETLRERISNAWDAVPVETINTLCESFPRRLQVCLDRVGDDCHL